MSVGYHLDIFLLEGPNCFMSSLQVHGRARVEHLGATKQTPKLKLKSDLKKGMKEGSIIMDKR